MDLDLLRKIDRIHPYPAKFTVDLAIKYIEKYSNAGDLIYDPFVGSGTTLLASEVLDRKSFGNDINHIAVLISKFKTLELSEKDISELKSYIENFKGEYLDGCRTIKCFSYPSVKHWFCENAIKALSFIKQSIGELKNAKQQLFCAVVMSSMINTISNQESDTRYAAKPREDLTLEKANDIYIKKINIAIDCFAEFKKLKRNLDTKVVVADSRDCSDLLGENTADMIFTSPPYINTYDYYLYHKHRMNWLEFDVKYSMEKEIGSRREFSSLKHKPDKFNADLKEIFLSCDKVLKKGGTAAIVIGDGKISGEMYDAKENIECICADIGWQEVDCSYSLLDQTSRSFQKSYRTKGKKEHILVFKKGI